MKKVFNRILYGGDYNPEQWPRDIWDEDMRLFRKAGINSASVNIFSWARIQPAEDTYDFSELDDIVDMLSRENIDIVLATPTAAMPAWMVRKYPEVSLTDFEGRRHKFGKRQYICPNSEVYKRNAQNIADKLAERYGANPRVVCWHVNNEYGGMCYCENCVKAFHEWLKVKYKTLDELNKAWNTAFWGHTIYDWDEITAPNILTEGLAGDKTSFAGISLDYRRFMSDSILALYTNERDAIRKHSPNVPITTNMMGTYKDLDYFKWAKEVDIISWDNYPRYDTPWSVTAMTHDLMRGLKSAPFMLMEQTPSQQNWAPYNSLKRPGQMRAQSYQTIAHGADTIQFFQLRRSAGACEKFHGAVIAHVGTENTRVFREVSELGHELKSLGDSMLGADNPAKVGIIFDWENYWALEYTSGPSTDLTYVEQIQSYYEFFYENNIPVDMIPVDADLTKYDAVIAPVLYMVKEGVAEALETFVASGGTLVTGFMSGIVNQSDNVHLGGYPGPLRKLAGVWVEEIDALAPSQTNTINFKDGTSYSCRLLCDLMHLEGADSLANYGSDFYAEMPAITRNSFGGGHVYYVGTMPDKAALGKALSMITAEAGINPLITEPTALEITRRVSDDSEWFFIINFKAEPQPLPKLFAGQTDKLTGELLSGDTMLNQYDVRLIRLTKT